jgi:nucleotide-binding universal stress UspA family protein
MPSNGSWATEENSMETTRLIHEDGQVLAAIDASVYTASVADHAAWAASRLGAPLEFIHAIDRRHGDPAGVNLSGNLSLGAQDDLLKELSDLDAEQGRLAQTRGRRLLEQVRDRAAGLFGVNAQLAQRHGGLVETLLEREAGVRLFVIGKRGEHADFASGHLGSNLERVMRAVHRPVLIAARAFKPIQRFSIAFDGSPTTRRCVQMVCASPLLKGLDCELLTVGEDTDERRQQMQWAKEQLQGAGFQPLLRYIDGSPDAVIPATVKEFAIDLLVMGAYGHSRIRNLIVGSTTTQVLRGSPIPVLLLR